jgi:multidrug efflux system membrane fusion protein
MAAEKRLPVEAYDQTDTQKLGTGYLLTADNQIDTTTGTGKLKAVFDNKDSALFPNQFVNIHLVLEERPNALVVPSAALQSGLQGSFVWVVDTDPVKKTAVAKMQPVKVALAEGQLTILDSGVQPGQNVVVDGAERLRAGQSVIANAAHQQHGGQAAGQATGQGAGQSAGQPGGKGNQPKKEQR